jgi:hypothetical protein
MVYCLYLLQIFLSVSISGMIVVVVLFFFEKGWAITIGGRNQCWMCISNLIYQLVALTLIFGPMHLGSSLWAYSRQIRGGLGGVILLPYTIEAFPLMKNGYKIKRDHESHASWKKEALSKGYLLGLRLLWVPQQMDEAHKHVTSWQFEASSDRFCHKNVQAGFSTLISNTQKSPSPSQSSSYKSI